MQTQQATIAQIIRSIGCDEFPVSTAHAVCRFAGFELATIVLHRPSRIPILMFNDFDAVNGLTGLHNYLSFTHRLNPMLKCAGNQGAFRASDFKRPPLLLSDEIRPYVLISSEEELGFRTIGWPPGLEEVGLYFQACGSVVELSIYRERRRTAAVRPNLAALAALCEPIAAAFDRNAALTKKSFMSRIPQVEKLSPRECQIADLILIGCTTEAIALRLAISPHTVKDYRKQIFRKLCVCSLAELFALYGSRSSRAGNEVQ
jgi:DNA-binding CsgD family transcriptional regulator